MAKQQPSDETYLRMAFDLAREAAQAGNHPFGAVLVHNGDVIADAANTVNTDEDETAHAEMNLMREALNQFAETYLRECTLFASSEPCAMCAGAIYISGIGRVVYGLPGARLAEMTEWAYATDCRAVFAAGSQPIEVIGPLLLDEAEAVHHGAWAHAETWGESAEDAGDDDEPEEDRSHLRPLKIDWQELQVVGGHDGDGTEAYLDLETGEVLFFGEDIFEVWEEVGEDAGSLEAALAALADHSEGEDLFDAELVKLAHVRWDENDRYLPVQAGIADSDYDDMAEFVETLQPVGLRRTFQDAIRGKGAFGRFRSLLRSEPKVEAAWRAFEVKTVQHRIREWLEEHDIDARFE